MLVIYFKRLNILYIVYSRKKTTNDTHTHIYYKLNVKEINY